MAARIERTVRDQRELLAAIRPRAALALGRARVGIELLRAGPSTAPEREARLDAKRELATVDTILGDLLAAARAGLTDLRTEEVPVVPFVRELVARFCRDRAPTSSSSSKATRARAPRPRPRPLSGGPSRTCSRTPTPTADGTGS